MCFEKITSIPCTYCSNLLTIKIKFSVAQLTLTKVEIMNDLNLS